MLGHCFARTLQPGDAIIISVANHESNIAPWVRLAERGIVIKWWGVDPETGLSSLDDLAALVSPRTRVVAVALTSNLVGDVVDVKRIAGMVRSVGAAVVVDCVAAAPHQALDAADWGVDFAVMSTYKVYGPHMGVLWGRSDAWNRLDGPNHFFLPEQGGKKFELGCVSYEGCAGLIALGEYFHFLAGTGGEVTRETIVRAYEVMKCFEEPVQARLLDYLSSRRDIRLIGAKASGPDRHPTVSFLHRDVLSPEVAAQVNRHAIGIRHGHMYAYRLCEAIAVPTETGVVRVSAVHTNTVEEIDRLIAVLDQV